MRVIRLTAGWATVLAFLLFGGSLLSNLDSAVVSVLLLVWLLGVMLWCAFGVIEEADHLAELLGEPFGTLILTLSIVVIEVTLISAVMLGADASPTVGRDTMFAVTMIALNAIVGLALVIGGLRHHEQSYSLPGATAYLSVIVPLATIGLVLPSVTTSTPDGTLTTVQAIAFSVATIALYIVFLRIQTVRHTEIFIHGDSAAADHDRGPVDRREILTHTGLLVVTMLPVVLLSKRLDKVVTNGVDQLGAPAALTGVVIALIVFTPEAVSALRAAYANQLQRTINLGLGACLSTIGLTVPAVLTIGLVTGNTVLLGLDSSQAVLLAATLLLSVLTFSGPKTTVLEGSTHLLLFFVYIVLLFSP